MVGPKKKKEEINDKFTVRFEFEMVKSLYASIVKKQQF